MDNQQAFMAKILELGELFDKKLSDSTIKLYWRLLSEFSDHQVQKALDLALIKCRFMPKPVEIIELIQGDAKSIAVDEWGKVLRLMRREGRFCEGKLFPAVLTTINQLGGWEYLCTLNHYELEFKGRDFAKLYEGKAERGQIGLDASHIERQLEGM